MKIGLYNTMIGCILILTLLTASSCTSAKYVKYFPGVEDGSIQSNTPFPESVIQKSDILGIGVSSLNPAASDIFNIGSSSGGAAGAVISPVGFLVNKEGNI